MSGDHGCVVDQSVLELFGTCRSREREELLRVFRTLARNPFQRGDYFQKSATGREVQVKRCGKWLITFWPDPPVLEF